MGCKGSKRAGGGAAGSPRERGGGGAAYSPRGQGGPPAKVLMWGQNEHGQLGDGANEAVAAPVSVEHLAVAG